MKLDSRNITAQLTIVLKALKRYALLWFVLFLAGVYGFVCFQIYNASKAQPADADITTQEQSAAAPRIDASVVDQILALQDHSVNVKTLFEQARKNPFSE